MSRVEIAGLASMILSGTLDPVDGVRRMVGLQKYLSEEDRRYPAFQTIVSVESETDDFPLSSAREHWEPRSLVELDEQKRAYLQQVEATLFEACRAIVRWSRDS